MLEIWFNSIRILGNIKFLSPVFDFFTARWERER